MSTIPAYPASVVAHPPDLLRIDPLDIVVVLASLVLTWATLYLLSNADSPESYQVRIPHLGSRLHHLCRRVYAASVALGLAGLASARIAWTLSWRWA